MSRELLPGAWEKDTQGEPKALTEPEWGSTHGGHPWRLLSQRAAPVGLSYRGKEVVVCLLISIWVQQI